ncbi:MAG: oligosaccharide flippase family protein [Gammaproteobacteria bacterium]|nr:oligosaccharide flippase family protein [Gammaproteobacteria bacterium]
MLFNRRVLGYISWQGMSMLIQAVTQFGVIAVLARFISAEEFGLVAAANIAVTFVQFVAEGGLGAAIVRKRDISPAYIGSALSVSLLIGVFSLTALAIVAVPFQRFYEMNSLALVVIILGVGSLFTGMSGVFEGLLQREMRFKSLFMANGLSWVVAYAFPAILLAMAGFGFWSIVVATLARSALKIVVLAFQCRGSLYLRWDRSVAGELARFGFGLTQFRFWSWSTAQAVPFAIGLLFGQERLGQFYLASQLAILPSQHLASVVTAVYFPVLSKALADPPVAAAQLGSVFTVLLVPVTAIGLLLAINSELVIELALGGGWSVAVVPFAILCIGAGLRSCLQISDAVNIARGDVYALANRKAICMIVMLVCLFVTQRYGLAGAAMSILVGHTLMLILTIPLIITGLKIERALLAAFAVRNGLALGIVVCVDILLWRILATDVVSAMNGLVLSVAANILISIPIAVFLIDRLRQGLVRRIRNGAGA